jgi:squalene synthase HpnC
MKITTDKLHDLTQENGGDYAVSSIDEAYSFCEKIALGHYENFPVGSLFIPRKQRKYVYAVYAFARIADDIADELEANKSIKLDLLNNYKNLLLDQTYHSNPIFVALQDLNMKLQIPSEPYLKLLKAFMMDADFHQPESYDDLAYYCQNSANPVGELILRIFGLYDEKTAYYSDNICTGLQLANFWQDFSLDLIKNRVYIPKSVFSKYNVNSDDIYNDRYKNEIKELLTELYDLTQKYFDDGKTLLKYLKPFRLKLEINATIRGGECILNKARYLESQIFYERPKLSKYDLFKIMINAIR